MRKKKMQLPIHGRNYRVKPFFSPCTYTAVFLSGYTDPAGTHYKNIFVMDDGSFVSLQFVETWEEKNP